jgi:hypothetical protein
MTCLIDLLHGYQSPYRMSIPDAKIFPHATGAAELLVAQHQEPQDLVFYSGWVCQTSIQGSN